MNPTRQHDSILLAIYLAPGNRLSGAQIAEAVGLSRYAKDGALSQLVGAELVIRRWPKFDGRRRYYHLTEAGEYRICELMEPILDDQQNGAPGPEPRMESAVFGLRRPRS